MKTTMIPMTDVDGNVKEVHINDKYVTVDRVVLFDWTNDGISIEYPAIAMFSAKQLGELVEMFVLVGEKNETEN